MTDLTDIMNAGADKHDDDKRDQPPTPLEQLRLHDPHAAPAMLGERAVTEREMYLEHALRYKHMFVACDLEVFHYQSERRLWTTHGIENSIYTYAYDIAYAQKERLFELRRVAEADRTQAMQEEITRLTKDIMRRETAKVMNGCATYMKRWLYDYVNNTADPSVRVPSMNRDPNVLGLAGTTLVDLKTGEHRHRLQTDYITRSTNVKYRPSISTAEWEKVVLDICNGDKALALFLKVWFGYCSTGGRKEQCMVIMWGNGNNGKNLLIDAVANALGEYAMAMPQGSLESSGKQDSGMNNNEQFLAAQMMGVRFAYISETGERNKMKESWVKAQTGDKNLRGRNPGGSTFEFGVSHKFTIGTNHKPHVTGTDNGIWRRIHLVQMPAVFGEQADVDAGLATHLVDRSLLDRIDTMAYREQVLKWLAEGAALYLANGLTAYKPLAVTAGTKSYRREQDMLGSFLTEVSDWVDNKTTDDLRAMELNPAMRSQWGKRSEEEKLRVGKKTLYKMYAFWAKDNGHQVMTQQSFANRVCQTQRVWTDDDTGAELKMPNLTPQKQKAYQYYQHIRLNEMGTTIRSRVLADERASTPGRFEEDDA